MSKVKYCINFDFENQFQIQEIKFKNNSTILIFVNLLSFIGRYIQEQVLNSVSPKCSWFKALKWYRGFLIRRRQYVPKGAGTPKMPRPNVPMGGVQTFAKYGTVESF